MQRDRELEAVQDLARAVEAQQALRVSLDRTGGRVARLEGKRVGGSRDEEVDRGAPNRARRRADTGANVCAHGDIVGEPHPRRPRHGRFRVRFAKRVGHPANRTREREPSDGVVNADLSVSALRQLVVRGGHRDAETVTPFDAVRPPAHEPLALVVIESTWTNDRIGSEAPAKCETASQAGREGERGKVLHFVDRPLAHMEPVHEVELYDAGVRHPRPAQVRGSVQERLRADRRGSDECEQNERSTLHGAPPLQRPSAWTIRNPQSAIRSVYRHSRTQRSYSTGTTPPCCSTSI